MSARIRVKVGQLQVEYEGTDEFIKNDLLSMVKEVIQLQGTVDLAAEPDIIPPEAPGAETAEDAIAPDSHGPNSIAAALDCNTGSDLVVAAAAYLTFVQGVGTFTRSELLEAMRSATSFYKSSYCNNLTNYIGTTVKDDDLRDIASGKYSLSHKAKQRLEEQLVS